MTERDRRRLGASDLRLIEKVDRVIQAMAREGWTVMVTDGARTQGQQMALYAKGRTMPGRKVTNADGIRIKSNHQLGRAADLCFVVNGYPAWDEDLPWELLAETAVAEGLVSGFYWKQKDKPHVELPPEPKGTLVA